MLVLYAKVNYVFIETKTALIQGYFINRLRLVSASVSTLMFCLHLLVLGVLVGCKDGFDLSIPGSF